MIALEGVSKSFGRGARTTPALEGVDLAVAAEEFVCLVGPSGCGKTTLLRLVAGLVAPDSGRATINGVPITGPGPDRAMVFQQPTLLPWADVLTNVALGLDLRGVPRADREATARRLIDTVGLTGFEAHFPRQLSGGMQQRVGLARALAVEPDILLMDEPFAAVDAQTRRLLQEELLRIHAGTRKTILFVTHDIDEAVRLGDRVLLMTPRPGHIAQDVAIPFARPRSSEDPDRVAQLAAIKDRLWRDLGAKA
jgi:NitT/TauT family transport system ATP-binding protein